MQNTWVRKTEHFFKAFPSTGSYVKCIFKQTGGCVKQLLAMQMASIRFSLRTGACICYLHLSPFFATAQDDDSQPTTLSLTLTSEFLQNKLFNTIALKEKMKINIFNTKRWWNNVVSLVPMVPSCKVVSQRGKKNRTLAAHLLQKHSCFVLISLFFVA